MADFNHVQSIQTVIPVGLNSSKVSVQLRIAGCFFTNIKSLRKGFSKRTCLLGSSDPLIITCPTLIVAENLSDLIDGYCRFVNNSLESIWTRKGEFC